MIPCFAIAESDYEKMGAELDEYLDANRNVVATLNPDTQEIIDYAEGLEEKAKKLCGHVVITMGDGKREHRVTLDEFKALAAKTNF